MGFFDKAEGTAQFFDQKDIEKAYGTKYKSKKLINGKWRYYYVDGREESVKWHDHNANKSEIREFIKESFNNSEYKENIKICDLPSHFSDKLKLKIGERPTKLIMNSDGLRHSLNLERHKINPEDILLLQKVIQNKHTIIRNAGKSKRRKNDLIEFTGYSRGTIKFILAIDEKNKELRLFDCYREGKIEKSVRFPCTSPETNALDGSQPIISINFIDNLSTEKLNKSLSIDDRLLRLWQRRLSPELENEGAGLLKIYNHICKETGLDFVTVVNKYGVTKDGYYYDLENPTEKFYFDLKNELDEKKDITEQVTSKLKTLKNENIKPEFAEKLQKSALNSQNEQITSKLQANKIEKSNSNHDALGRFTFGKKLAPDTGLTGNVINSDDVKHEDGFVLTKNGSKDFGEISKEFAKEIGRQFGKIRLMEGWHDSNSDKGSGEKHIERPKRMKQLNQVGFTNARDFVQDICDGYDAIYSSGMSLMLVKTKDLYTCIVELTPADEDFYDVKTAYVSSKNNIKNKINKQKIRLVWNSPTSLDLSKSLIPYNSKSISSIPTGFIKGTSDNSIIPNSQDMSSKNIAKSTISDKLFRLWQRRLSPELQKEMEKYVDEHSRVYSLFSSYKDVYDIKGYPKGLDLENNILLELGDTYFVVSCGGDWQDEKLVKFSIGEDDKLKAEVVDKCDKEDKRVLKKKLAYIINPETINKSLTYSGYKLQGRTKLYGMDISIENKKGSYRSGVDSDGHKWKTYMNYDYGYIRGTVGTDSDHVDCYIGPDKKATKVYVIHQNNPVTHKYDEDKCMLCFESADAAKNAYMKQYDRPGFFGSMETLTIDQFKSFVFSKQGSRIHKSFDVIVTDITENNKLKKVEQLEKSLTALKNNQPFVIRHIPRDESTYYGNVTLKIRNFKEDSIEKAVRTLSMSLGVPVKSPKGEVFLYKAQEDLTDKWCSFFSGVINDIYDFVTDYFDLPKMTVMSKANLSYKGKVLYYPDTGKPIKEADWKKFVSNLEKFLNRNIKDSDKKIILESSALAKILNRMLKYNTLDAVTKKRLEGLSYKDKSFDWISDSVKNMQAIFKNKDKDEVLTRNEQARIQIMQQSAAQRITGVTNKIKDDVQQVLIDGVKSRKSRSQVSQDLFDKMVGDNRDFQRIADTEIQNACNNAFIREEVYNSAEGEKVYFQRLEIVDDNICSFCRQMNGKIALWSEVPLPNEKVKDDIAEFALWEGKEWNGKGHCVAMGVFHPYCRGNWIRYKPELKGLESK